MMNRRQFLATTAVGSLVSTVSPSLAAEKRTKHKICAFTKPFNSLSFEELAKQMASIGFDGIEAPIRPGGHIEPEQVDDKLPELVETLKKHQLEVTVLTSSINDPKDPLTEKVLRAAAKLGIRRYRMKYFKYDLDKPIAAQIPGWKPQVKDLAAMNKDLGITGLYQNHAGKNYVGAAIWDLPELLDGIDKQHVGVAYDIRHATVEGGTTWPLNFRRIRPHIETVYVKDFQWIDSDRPKNVPLGEGRINGPEFIKLLRKTGFDGPISLHEEYLDHKKPELVPDHLAALKADLGVLKKWLT